MKKQIKSTKNIFRWTIYVVEISLLVLVLILPKNIVSSNLTSNINGVNISNSANQDTIAIYSVIFEGKWSQETHPHPNGSAHFPANAHFSGLIGATHDTNITYWEAGGMASPGVEQVAETGIKTTSVSEINAEIANNTTYKLLSGEGIDHSPGSVSIDSFQVNKKFPLVFLISMVAPSPDWFVGVSNLSLLDDNGEWIARKVVELYPYDAGTEDGSDYFTSYPDTDPQQPISSLKGISPFSDQIVGTFTFIRESPTGITEDDNLSPDQYILYQNYPNPFNSLTKISYSIPISGLVTVKIYDVLGKEIQTLVNRVQEPGLYFLNFNARTLTSGVYFYKLQVNDFVESKKMLFVK